MLKSSCDCGMHSHVDFKYTEDHNVTKAVSSIDFEWNLSHLFFIYVDIWLFNPTYLDKIIYLSVMCKFCHNKLQNISSVLFNPTSPCLIQCQAHQETSTVNRILLLKEYWDFFSYKECYFGKHPILPIDPYHLVGFLSPPCHVDLLSKWLAGNWDTN